MAEEYGSFYIPPPEQSYAPTDYGPVDTSAQQQMYDFGQQSSYPAYYDSSYGAMGGPSTGTYAQPEYTPQPADYAQGGPSTGVNNAGGGGGVADWMSQLWNSFTGGGGGAQGAAPSAGGGQGQSWMNTLMSLGSGIYGVQQANRARQQAKAAIPGSAPWTASGGTAMAGEQLKGVIAGDFTKDAGFNAAQQSAARASSQQPGGFAASAAAQAALKYQNDRIQALGPAAGVGFSPAAGYQTAVQGTQGANQLAGQGLASVGYGMTPQGQGMPPWLQAYLVQNGMGARP